MSLPRGRRRPGSEAAPAPPVAPLRPALTRRTFARPEGDAKRRLPLHLGPSSRQHRSTFGSRARHSGARAGTSERTVYRLFGTKERLLAAWLSEIGSGVGPPPDPSLRNDTKAFVRVMVAFYEERGASILNMLAQEEAVPALRPLMEWGRNLYDEGLERGLGHLLRGFRGAARQRRRMQLVVACDVYTWKLLRHGRGLTQGETERVIEDLLNILEKAEPTPI